MNISETRRLEAVALGHAWADQRAERLRDRLPADEWPDFWDDADNGPLPEDTDAEAQAGLGSVASRAAHERWRELTEHQRALEKIEEDEQALEASASDLEAELRRSLPQGIAVDRDGSRVFLQRQETGDERTVSSLESAWRVIEEWSDSRRPVS